MLNTFDLCLKSENVTITILRTPFNTVSNKVDLKMYSAKTIVF